MDPQNEPSMPTTPPPATAPKQAPQPTPSKNALTTIINKNKTLALISLLIITLAIPVSMALVKNSQDIRSKATGETSRPCNNYFINCKYPVNPSATPPVCPQGTYNPLGACGAGMICCIPNATPTLPAGTTPSPASHQCENYWKNCVRSIVTPAACPANTTLDSQGTCGTGLICCKPVSGGAGATPSPASHQCNNYSTNCKYPVNPSATPPVCPQGNYDPLGTCGTGMICCLPPSGGATPSPSTHQCQNYSTNCVYSIVTPAACPTGKTLDSLGTCGTGMICCQPNATPTLPAGATPSPASHQCNNYSTNCKYPVNPSATPPVCPQGNYDPLGTCGAGMICCLP